MGIQIAWQGNKELKYCGHLGTLENDISQFCLAVGSKFRQSPEGVAPRTWMKAASVAMGSAICTALSYSAINASTNYLNETWTATDIAKSAAPLALALLLLLGENYLPSKHYSKDVTEANIKNLWMRLALDFAYVRPEGIKECIKALKVERELHKDVFDKVYHSIPKIPAAIANFNSIDSTLNEFLKVSRPYQIGEDFKDFEEASISAHETRQINAGHKGFAESGELKGKKKQTMKLAAEVSSELAVMQEKTAEEKKQQLLKRLGKLDEQFSVEASKEAEEPKVSEKTSFWSKMVPARVTSLTSRLFKDKVEKVKEDKEESVKEKLLSEKLVEPTELSYDLGLHVFKERTGTRIRHIISGQTGHFSIDDEGSTSN